MRLVRSIKAVRKLIKEAKLKNKTVGFVPTMGYLHAGHASLLRTCKRENDISVMSIFVNRKQFGPKEDFTKYPRDIKNDIFFAKKENVDIIFYPSEKEIYPAGYLTFVNVNEITDCLCGKSRPGHFKGVTTVVAKLLNIVSADTMYLGQKDAQQAIVLKKMVADLNIPVTVKVLPTVREKSGLAMSSRNSYLTQTERATAATLYAALSQAKKIISKGERNASKITNLIKSKINQAHAFKIDYVECRDAQTLGAIKTLQGRVLIALAVWLKKTRLIDNVIVSVK